MNINALKNIAFQAGLSQSEIQQIYNKAVFEASHLGKENDENFILSIVRTFSGLDEEDLNKTIQNLNTKFLESDYKDFNKFLEDMWVGGTQMGGIVSTDFPPAVRPEHALNHKVKFPPEDDKEKEDEDKKV